MNKLHPIKTMFMGVVTSPVPEHDFNGLIHIKRLSEQYVVWRDTHRYRFSQDYDINQQIVSGEWRQIYDDPTYNIAELTLLITEFYNLDRNIEEMICFHYQD